MTKKLFSRLARIMLPALAVFLALCCAGCSGSSSVSKVDGYTGGYNTEENLALFRRSNLYALAEGWRAAAAHRTTVVSDVGGTDYTFAWHRPVPTTPEGPFLAVSVRKDETSGSAAGDMKWQVLGGTAKQMDLSGVKTLAVCIISTRYKTYQEVGGSSARAYSGSAEDAEILYIDVASRDLVGLSERKGKSLPSGYTSNVPHYTLSTDDLVSQIRSDLSTPFTLSEDGEITGGTLSRELDGYLFPASVKKITKLEIKEGIETLSIPASVEEIAADIIPRDAVKLTVLPGTYGETFARENGFLFRYPDDSRDSSAPWRICVAGCSCTVDKATLPSILHPDGPFADMMKSRILTVEEGSAAEAYAREHRYLYRRLGETEKRFCIDGSDWILGKDIVFIPDGVTAEDEVLSWIGKKNYTVIAAPGSSAETACREAGLVCWSGDYDLAERTFSDDHGLEWTVIYSFSSNHIRAVHIPAEYEGSGDTASRRFSSLFRTVGLGSASQAELPLCYVQHGSWASDHMSGWLEEGSTVLHSPVQEQYTDYALERVTEVVDGETDDRMLDRGVRFLRTNGNYSSWFRAADHPDKMYLVSRDNKRWHLNNDMILKDVRVLKIRGDITDEAELDRILYRAEQGLPFVLEVERNTGIAAFAQEHGIPFIFWESTGTNFYDGDGTNADLPSDL